MFTEKVELQLLLEIVQISPNKEKIGKLLKKGIKLEYLFNLASANGVLPLLEKVLTEKQVKLNLSQITKKVLEIKKTNFFMSAQLLQLNYLLQKKNIKLVPIKGPVLAVHAYKDLSLRPFSDLDILVQKENLTEVALTLLGLGYKCEHPIEALTHPYILKKFVDITFSHPKNNIIIELHWKLLKMASAELSCIQTLFKNSYTIHFQNTDLNSLPLEEEFLYLCIHAAKHRFERIEWMNDLKLLCLEHQDTYDWERLFQIAKKEKSMSSLLLALSILRKDFSLSLPSPIPLIILQQKKIDKLYKKVWALHADDYILQEKKKGVRYMELSFSIYLEDSYLRKLSLIKAIFFPLHKDDILARPKLAK